MQYPGFGQASFDTLAPMGTGDVLNWRFDWTVPATFKVEDETGAVRDEPAAGKSLNVTAYYVDGADVDAAVAYGYERNLFQVKP
jgi:hypothetical protein